MSTRKILTALLSFPVATFACSGTWQNNLAGNWSTTANWGMPDPGCYPGETGTTDVATLGTNPTGAVAVTLDVSPTINQLIFNNNTANPAYTITPFPPANTLDFVGTLPLIDDQVGSQLINAPLVLNTDTLTITVEGVNDALTLAGNVTDVGTSSILIGNDGINPNLGTLNTINNSIIINGNFSLNTGTGDTGTLVNTNTNSVASGNIGSQLSSATGNFTMSAGELNNDNSGTVISSGAAQTVGCQINIPAGTLTVNGGTILNDNSNTITYNGTSTTSCIGSLITAGSATLSGATLQNNNSGEVDTQAGVGGTGQAFGSQVVVNAGDFTVNAGSSVQNNNSGPVTFTMAGGQPAGSQIDVLAGDFVFNGAVSDVIDNNNSGLVTVVTGGLASPNAVGSLINVPNGNFTMTGGTLNSINSSIFNSDNIAGSAILLAGGDFSLTGGTINMGNTAAIQGPGVTGAGAGSALDANSGTSFSISGANTFLNLSNTGAVTNTVGVALTSLLPSNTISGNLIATNTQPVLTTLGSVAAGGGVYVIFAQGLTLNAPGSITLDNSGSVTDMAMSSIGASGVLFFLESGPYVQNGAGSSFSNKNSGTLTNTPLGSAFFVFDTLTVNSGTFLNDALVGGTAFTMNAGSTVSGNGIFDGLTITSNFTNNGGTFAPGDPTGTMTFTNPNLGGTTNYIQTAGTFVVNILNTSTFGNLLAYNAQLLGGNLEVVALPGYIPSPTDTFVVINTLETVSGQFAQIFSQGLPSGFTPQLRYTPNQVILFFLTPPPPSCSILTSFFGSFPQTIFSEITEINTILEREMQRLRARYRPCSPPRSKKQKPVVVFDEPAEDLLVSNQSYLAWGSYQRMRKKQAEYEQCLNDQKNWNIFAGPLGIAGEAHTRRHLAGFDYWSTGGIVGADYAFRSGGVGALANYQNFKGDGHHHQGHFNIDHAHGSFYGTYGFENCPLSFDGIVGGGYEWYKFSRHANGDRAVGKPRGSQFDALLDLEYTLSKPNGYDFPSGFQIIPMASLQYIYMDVSKYHEHGADLADLMFKSQQIKSLTSVFGAWFNYNWDWKNFDFTMEANLGWQREYFNRGRSVHYAAVNASEFAASCPLSSASASGGNVSLSMPSAKRNTFLAGLDFYFLIKKKWAVEASYDFQWNSLFQNHNVYIGFNAAF
jgi:hypothetical protein